MRKRKEIRPFFDKSETTFMPSLVNFLISFWVLITFAPPLVCFYKERGTDVIHVFVGFDLLAVSRFSFNPLRWDVVVSALLSAVLNKM